MKNFKIKNTLAICNDIESLWKSHVIVRAAFPAKMNVQKPHKSPSYYARKGVQFTVISNKIDRDYLPEFKLIPHWLNQNFIIRLYGILDEYKILYCGKLDKHPIIELLYFLRQKVGAHSVGRNIVKKNYSKKAFKLMQNYINKDISLCKFNRFIFPIDTILEHLKTKIVKYVKSLEGREIQIKKSKRQKKHRLFWFNCYLKKSGHLQNNRYGHPESGDHSV